MTASAVPSDGILLTYTNIAVPASYAYLS